MARQLTIELLGDSSKAEKAFRSVGDASEHMASDVKDNAGKTRRSLDDVGEGFDTGEQRIVGFRDAITGTSDIMTGFREGDIVGMATGFADLASSVANFVVPAITRLGAMLGISTAATSAAAGANTTFGASLTAALGPIALVIAAIAAIIAIGYLVVRNWDTIKDAATAVWEWIRDRFGDVINFFTDLPGKLLSAAGDLFGFVEEKMTDAKNWVSDRLGDIVGFYVGMPGRLLAAAGDLFGFVAEKMTDAKNWVSDRLGDIVGFIAGMPDRIARAAAGMWDGIKEAFKGALNWLIDRWNGLEFKIPGFKVGPVGYEGFTLGVPDIPRLATGGITTGPTLAMVGDNPGGREAIIPLSGDTPGLGRTYQLTVYALDSTTAAETVVRAIDEYEALNGSRYARA